jgi:hypothetical protein
MHKGRGGRRAERSKAFRSPRASVKEIQRYLGIIRKGNFLTRGYMCGVVNGLRLAEAIIKNEKPIFERDEEQPEPPSGIDIVFHTEVEREL